ncbi:MAG: hypothetical protein DME07_09285, partial [Candidatus Rokuibacteriota bacterium]
MNQARAGHTATLLANGTVLIAGGKDAAGRPLATAELYDPAIGHYTQLAASLPAPVWGHTATLLNDGSVLIAGGEGNGGLPVVAAQLFDPGTGTFTAVGSMATPRSHHTATQLHDGRLLVAGGTDGSNALATLEVYDPATRTFSLAPSALRTPRQAHTATLLNDRRLLLAGGSNSLGALNSAELYDPAAGTIRPGAPLNVPRTLASAALLLDGTVLVAGGQSGQNLDLDTAEVYNPATDSFTLLPTLMSTARSGHLGVQLLHNGKLLVSGGTRGGQVVATAEIYDPVTGTFRPVDTPATARWLFGANFFALPYPGILLATGGLDSAQSPLASSEVFFYPTLRTDKRDYLPGDRVAIMGEGWHPNETVSINIHESSGDPDTNLTATADVIGSFINQQFIVQISDQGVTFFATATGHASRWTAQTMFTDGNVKAFAAPSGTTFTLTKSAFSNATCSGAPSSTATATAVNSSSGNTSGVGNTESVRLEAAASSDQSTTFINWSSSNPFTVVAPRAICAPGFSGGGSRDYFANYAGGGADLSITKTDSPDPVAPGGTLTYSINVGNAGPNAAVAVTMSDPLPSQTTFQSVAPPAGWSCTTPPVGTTGTVSCTTSSLASGAPASFTIVVQVTPATADGTTISNTATVSSSVTSDPTSTNNSATATTTVTVTTTSADLSIAKTDAPDPVSAGATLTYTLTVSNAGPSTAAAPISVTDSLPPGVTFQGASGAGWTCSGTNTSVACTRASTLPPGAAPPITILVTAPNEGSTITNTASVSSSTSDPDASNNTATASTTVIGSADLSITKTDAPDPVAAGAALTYTLTVSNAGPSTAAAPISVTDSLPPGVTFQGASGAGWTCSGTNTSVACTRASTLPPGAAPPITILVTAPNEGGTITNTASVSSSTSDPDSSNNTATASTTVIASADLSITKTDAPDPVTAGAALTYTLTVSNAGPSTAAAPISVTDSLPPGVTFQGASGAGWTC